MDRTCSHTYTRADTRAQTHWQVMKPVLLANLYGTVALARISSLDTAVGLIGTGLGPVLFGVCR